MKHARFPTHFLAGLALSLLWQTPIWGGITESFESAEPSLRVIDQDCWYRLEEQARTSVQVHGGNASEYVRIAAGPGTRVIIGQRVPAARVIEELAPELWIRSDRAGLQMMARVVLPRTVDPRTGRPIVAYVIGDIYQDVHSWRQLRIDGFSKRLADHVRILRQKHKRLRIDPQEAYVDYLAVNVHPGQGTTNVWFDDLAISGYAEASARLVSTDSTVPEPADLRAERHPSKLPDIVRTQIPVRVQGSTVMARGRPFFARIIEHNGESFSWLHLLGFNVVKLAATPSAAQLHEAATVGLWIVAPPPPGRGDSDTYGNVLAWDLGSHLASLDLPAIRKIAARLRTDSRCPAIVGSGHRDLGALAAELDVLIHDQPVLGSSFELAEQESWLRSRHKLARRQQPFWVGIATELAEGHAEQLELFGHSDAALVPQLEQLRLMAFQAIATGGRGLYFRSHSRLDGRDEAARIRTAMLQSLNRELVAVEPWAAAGRYAGRIETSDARVIAHLLQTDRARLLIALQHAAQQQFVVGPVTEKRRVSFYVNGIPITDQMYRFDQHQLEPLRAARDNQSFACENVGLVTLALLTQDPLAVSHLNRTLGQSREATARLKQDITQFMLTETQSIVRQVDRGGNRVHQASQWLLEADQLSRRSEQLLHSGDFSGAHRFNSQANNHLRRVRQKYWEQAAIVFPSPISSPLCTTFSTLPTHYRLAARGARWGGNALAAGQCEDLQHLLQSGWQQLREADPRITAKVELSGADTYEGRSSMRLTATESRPGDPVEGWPVRIVSAPVSARRGQLVRINGWTKIPQAITGSHDGLMIFDSSAGLALAQRIQHTRGWQEFTLYRAARRDGPLTVTLALTGLGEVWLDDISISLAE
ncbi:MAG TPA: hypothetical protein QF564_26310 [Pirellulaceae bacterium]|nr:hypothetical protein [Pirellulaceae bacterium]